MAEYKVVPFTPKISTQEGSDAAASQLQELCTGYAADGWEFRGLNSVETYVAGTTGCFGLGATPPSTISFPMAVFKR